jgi:hypothetical protein
MSVAPMRKGLSQDIDDPHHDCRHCDHAKCRKGRHPPAQRGATSTMVRYRVVRRTLAGRATLPISRSSPPESAPSDRTARSGSERMYLYRTGALTLRSIRAASTCQQTRPNAQPLRNTLATNEHR